MSKQFTHRCRNCGKPHDLHVHHIVERAHGGSNDPENLITLCRTCHSSVHAGVLKITAARQFTFADGTPTQRIAAGVRTLTPALASGTFSTA